jgi:hypothetical protein
VRYEPHTSIPIPGWPLVETPDSAPQRSAGTTQHHRECAVREQRAADPWRDVQGVHIPVRARVEQAKVDTGLGMVR